MHSIQCNPLKYGLWRCQGSNSRTSRRAYGQKPRVSLNFHSAILTEFVRFFTNFGEPLH
jgi:hypothetical protein